MTSETRTLDQFAAHAVCIAASVRDLGRAAQFYSRDMSNVDGGIKLDHVRPTMVSRVVAFFARAADGVLTWFANTSVKLLLPSWRKLPSPFEPGITAAVLAAIKANSLLHNPLFNAYFYRAAKQIAEHYADRPNLVLEHRVDAARRSLAERHGAAADGSEEFMAQLLLALVQAKPVARIGQARAGRALLLQGDPNVAVFTVAVTALLFARSGKPVSILDEAEFFRVVAALVSPRINAISAAIESEQVDVLAREIRTIESLY